MLMCNVCFLATYAQSKEGMWNNTKLKFEHVSRSLNFYVCMLLFATLTKHAENLPNRFVNFPITPTSA